MRNDEVPCLWDVDRATALRAFVGYNLALGAVAPLENTFTLFLTPLSASLEEKIALVNVSFSVLILVFALVGPYFSGLGQRHGIETCILVGLITNTAASVGITAATTLPQLYLCYLVAGVGIGAIYSPCVVAAMQLMPARYQALAAGITCVNYLLLPTLIASPVRYLIAVVGWKKALVVQGGLSLLVFVISYVICPRGNYAVSAQVAREVRRSEKILADESSSSVVTPKRSRFCGFSEDFSPMKFSLFYIACCLVSIVYYFAEAESQVVFEMELPEGSIGIFVGTTINLVANTSARLGAGLLASKFRACLVLSAATALATSCLICWALAPASTSVSLLASAGVTVGSASMWPLLPVIAAETFGSDRASTVYAWAQTSQIIAAFLGAPGIAQLGSFAGWPKAMDLLACMSASCAVVLLVLAYDRKSEGRDVSNISVQAPAELEKGKDLIQTPNPTQSFMSTGIEFTNSGSGEYVGA
jgi:MFS family permease